MKEIILTILFIVFIFSIINLIILSIPTTCNYIYFHKDWKTWKYFIKNADKFQIEYVIGNVEVYMWEQYKAVIWNNVLCSIHTENEECIVSTYNKKLSKQMTAKLKEIAFKNE